MQEKQENNRRIQNNGTLRVGSTELDAGGGREIRRLPTVRG